MRVAALYDIHGNLPALEAVLAEPDVAGADVVVVGGDAIAGPMPELTLRTLAALGERVAWVAGNNEREMFERRESDPGSGGLWDRRASWVGGRLTPAELASVADWPGTIVVDVDGLGPVLFCHATSRSDSEIFTAITPPAVVEPMLAGIAEATVVCGHTHVQFDRRIGGRRVVNAGSVGMPYEELPGARWCLLGPDVDLRTTPYDVVAAAERIRATELPEAAEFAEVITQPPTAQEATREFEALAGGGE
jgi:predicted phosphodiesterase